MELWLRALLPRRRPQCRRKEGWSRRQSHDGPFQAGPWRVARCRWQVTVLYPGADSL